VKVTSAAYVSIQPSCTISVYIGMSVSWPGTSSTPTVAALSAGRPRKSSRAIA
jgi:hypothetical protein